jgi:hypothetical protein
MQLQERDKAVARAVHDFRVLHQDQIETLLFGSRQTAQLRLAKLYDHGFLDRRPLPTIGGAASSPILYVLDKRGAELLRAEYGIDAQVQKKGKKLGVKFLEHTIDINTFRVAVVVAARDSDYELEQWIDDQSLSADYDRVDIPTPKGTSRSVAIIPDGYFVLNVPWISGRARTRFCLELDRGTMDLGRFKSKILAYIAYVESGAYSQRYQSKSLRVLTVTTSLARLANLKAKTEQAGGHEAFFFTTLDQVSSETIFHDEIWEIAGSAQRHALLEPKMR